MASRRKKSTRMSKPKGLKGKKVSLKKGKRGVPKPKFGGGY
jgi:hypothetical protein